MSNGHRNLHTVCERFGWKCYHCGAAIRCAKCHPNGQGRKATRDHFIPRSQGGGGGLNLVASCIQCNLRKGDGTPRSKRPKARSLGGCQFGRSSLAARTRRPRKSYQSAALAVAMCEAVFGLRGVELVAWFCPGCERWHVDTPATVPRDSAPWIRPSYATAPSRAVGENE